jgi:hypothetical protein
VQSRGSSAFSKGGNQTRRKRSAEIHFIVVEQVEELGRVGRLKRFLAPQPAALSSSL